MAKEENEAQPEAQATEAKPKGKKKLIIIIGAVVLLIVIGGVAVLFLSGGSKTEGEGEEAAKEEHEPVHYMQARLEPFIVNLSESTSFVKVSMVLEYDPKILERGGGHGEGGGGYGGGGSGGGGEGEGGGGGLPPVMKEREPMIRDAVIRVISSKKSAEVLTVEGKDKLKEELLEAINEAIGLEESAVVNIYFDDFIIQ